MIHTKQSGFTAVELLITLFVAAAFLVAGYQLYSVIIKDSGQTRGEARASNVAYDYIRRYTSSATNPCATSTPVNNASITVAGISAVTVTVAITCPYTSRPSISKVEATVRYNTPQQTVKYATFLTGVGAPSNSTTPTGIVGWWKLNGNANDSSGNGYTGTISGATAATGQGGQNNTAYSFNGTSNYINSQITIPGGDYQHTISLWVYPTSLTGAAARVDPLSIGAAAGNTYSAIDLTTTSVAWYFYNNDISMPNPLPLNQWSFLTFTYKGGGGTIANKTVYINGTVYAMTASGGAYGQLLNLPASSPIGIGYDRGRNTAFFPGIIDDVRIYNRPLTSLEVSNLYAEGAQ